MIKFDEKIRSSLKFVGFIGAIIMCIAYIVLTFTMIIGFTYEQTTQTIVFAIINALVGFLVTILLAVQGISLAKETPDYKAIRAQYVGTKTKDKKNHSMVYFWVTTVAKNLIFKGGSVALTTYAIIKIVIMGSNDWNLLLLALVNLLMFICFGLLALDGAYTYVLESYIPYMKDKLNEREVQKDGEQESRKDD